MPAASETRDGLLLARHAGAMITAMRFTPDGNMLLIRRDIDDAASLPFSPLIAAT